MSRVLLVTNRSAEITGLVHALLDQGFGVFLASDAKLLRERLDKAYSDLVLCPVDPQDPVNWQMAQEVAKTTGFEGRKLALISEQDLELWLRCLDLGFDSCIGKNRPIQDMVQRIRLWADEEYTPVAERFGICFEGQTYQLPADRLHWQDLLISFLEELTRLQKRFDLEMTQRHQVEEQLRKSRERFELAVMGTGDGIWDWDVITNEVYYSRRWKAMLGFEPNEISNEFDEWVRLIHPEDKERALSTLRAHIEGKSQIYELEHRLRHKDGHYRWILSRGISQRDDQGKLLRMAGAHCDIHDRKRTEEQLREQTEVLTRLAKHEALLGDDPTLGFRLFTEAAAQTLKVERASIWLYDPQHTSIRCVDLFGSHDHKHFNGTELKKADFPTYFEALEADEVIAAHNAITDSRTAEFRESYLEPLGITSMLDAPLRLRGQLVGVLCNEHVGPPRVWDERETNFVVSVAALITVFLETAERKRAEEESRLARAAAEAANQAKSTFLANMSHEIRTPMNAIIGMSELVLATDLTADQRENLELVKKSADNLLGILNDILDFSKIEAGKLDMEIIDFSLRDTLDDAIATMGIRAAQKGLELACRVAPEVPDDLRGDPGRLRQVILNLVNNSLKFTDRGEVYVEVNLESTPPLHNGRQRNGKPQITLLVSIHDTGIGIAKDKLQAIFGAFTQADSSTTRKYGGTGLGLAITERLVQLMGGRIWVESQVSEGSTFSFTAIFDIGKPTDRASDTVAPLVEVRNLPVLIVDDNATNRRILTETLRNWRMRPTEADGAVTALQALETARNNGDPFVLILLDVHMPGVDGFTLAERILQLPHSESPVIMMLTSGSRPGDATRCRELGVAGFLSKPIRQAELWRAIQSVLGASVAAQKETTPLPSPATERKLKILLVEDNPINQKLAVRILEKEGHILTVAGNGREALAALEVGRYDLVLMDVQMPEMDGLEATDIIRRKELQIGGHIPIVAMTAHAMKGDRERCLAYGMDGYVSKPIHKDELFAVIDKVVPRELPNRSTEIPPEPQTRSSPPLADLVEWKKALAAVGGDEDLLRDLGKVFIEQGPQWMADLERAIVQQDATAIANVAHPLKSSLGTFGATKAAQFANNLERAARRKELETTHADWSQLTTAVDQLLPALKDFVCNPR